MASTEQKCKIKSQSEILSMPYYIVRKDHSRGAKQGPTQWQYDHSKAKETTRNVRKKGYDSISPRWQDDVRYRNSQIAVGWTEEYCQYVDSLLSIDFSLRATRRERERYENNLTLGVKGQGTKSAPMKNRPDFSQAVHHLIAITAGGKDESAHSQTIAIPTTSNERKNNIGTSMDKLGVGTIGHNLLPLQLGGRHKNGKNKYMVNLFKNEKIINDVFRLFRLQALSIPLLATAV